MSYDFLTPCMHKTTALLFKGITRERHACFAVHYFFLLFVCLFTWINSVTFSCYSIFFVVAIFQLAESPVIYCAHFFGLQTNIQ